MPFVLILQNDYFSILINKEIDVPRDGQSLAIDLAANGVPIEAYSVTLFAYTQDGWHKDKIDDTGHFEFSTYVENGTITRRLFFHAYQGATGWSYNSDNITLPVEKDRTVYAEVDFAKTYGIQCRVKVVGYRKRRK